VLGAINKTLKTNALSFKALFLGYLHACPDVIALFKFRRAPTAPLPTVPLSDVFAALFGYYDREFRHNKNRKVLRRIKLHFF
jgi:hypothetical protein